MKRPKGFRVELKFPFDDDFEEVTERAVEAAQKQPSDSGAGGGVRDVGWTTATFKEAQDLRTALRVAGFEMVAIREE